MEQINILDVLLNNGGTVAMAVLFIIFLFYEEKQITKSLMNYLIQIETLQKA